MPGGQKVDSKNFNYITPYVVKLSMCTVEGQCLEYLVCITLLLVQIQLQKMFDILWMSLMDYLVTIVKYQSLVSFPMTRQVIINPG